MAERPRLVLLHGGGLGPWSYRRHVAALSPDFECEVPLLPAHEERVAEPFVWDDVVKELVLGIERHGSPVFLAGLSLGGQAALAVAGERPDLVAGLLVTGANTHGIPAIGPALALSGPLLPLKNSALLTRASAKRMHVPEAEWPEFLKAARELTMASLRSFMKASSDFRAPAGLAQLTAPTLVMRGQREAKVIKRSVPEVAALVAGARTAMAPGLAHPWPLMDADLFVRTCRSWFLDGEVAAGLVPIS